MYWKKVLASATAAGILLGGGAGQAKAEVWYERQLTSESGWVSAAENPVPAGSPRWTVDYGRPGSSDDWSADRIVVGDKQVYYIQNGKVAAVELASGKRAWTFGSSVSSIAIADGTIYALSSGGSLSRLNAATGVERWRAQIDAAKDSGSLVAEPGSAYVKYPGGLYALDAETGHRRWHNTDAYSHGLPVPLKDMLLFATSESGAVTHDVTYAIDKATGKTLWEMDGIPLQVRGDVTYIQYTFINGIQEPYALRIDAVSTKDGSSLDKKVFIPLAEGEDPFVNRAGRAVMNGNDVIAVGPDERLYRMHVDADPANLTAYDLYGSTWIAGPVAGKLFFRDPDGFGLHGLSTFDNARTDYNGLDNPVERLDVHGKGLFVGQTDGDVVVFDVAAGKALFRCETDTDAFGPFRVAGDTLLVQTETKLLAFTLPAELRPIKSDMLLTKVYPKAEASLRIDGAEHRFDPPPVMIDNRMFVPLRSLFEAVGASVDFNAGSGDVDVTYGDRAFSLREGTPFALVAGEQRALSYAPANINAAVYIPLRDIGGLLGVDVQWSHESRTVDIGTER
ncbi:PQQ-binding-like beta-propeller repeat protein [Paenibacillus sp. TRM 82003]|nr:PQQ-binding-like beta-propeller repeat protein [Paenibacillus sp. TRM 82003]